MTARLWMGAVLLVGCSDPEQFRVELDDASCAWQSECNAFIDYDACMQAADEAWEPMPDDCRFRKKQANQCLDGFDSLPCPGSGTVALPAACDRVWECD